MAIKHKLFESKNMIFIHYSQFKWVKKLINETMRLSLQPFFGHRLDYGIHIGKSPAMCPDSVFRRKWEWRQNILLIRILCAPAYHRALQWCA